MKIYLLAYILSILLYFILSNKVITVNDTNYEEYILNNDYLTIYFHATWSDDSKQLRSHFLSLPQSISTNKTLIYLETTS